MGSTGTMGRLSVGTTALQTHQYALNATSHNIINTQTDGYSRQQVLLTDRPYNDFGLAYVKHNQVGLGVVTGKVRQVRDHFADALYRRENGKLNFYKAQYEAVAEVESYFGELEGRDFNSTIDSLWYALQEMQKESSSIVTRSSFISTAEAFLDRVKEIRSALITYQRNLNVEITSQVSRINELANDIQDMNKAILAVEGANIESANDYKDKRNAALDELSGIVKTEYYSNDDGTLEVYIEGRCIVTKGRVYEIETMKVADNEDYEQKYGFTSRSTDFYMPVWGQDKAPLFNINKPPTMKGNTDLGSLKGLLQSRGYFITDYTDVPVKPTKPVMEDYASDADYQDALTQYEADSATYAEELKYFQTYVEPYTIPNLMAQFDVLTHGIMAGMNDILCPNKEVTLADGSTIKILDEENAAFGMGSGDGIAGTELFTRRTVPRYTEQEITLADGSTITAKVYNEEDPDDFYSLYSSGNTSVNVELLQNPSLLPLTTKVGEEAQGVVDRLLDLWNNSFATVSPNSLVNCNFKDYYAGMMDDLSDRGYTFDAMVKTQDQSVVDVDNARQGVLGVSSDEELSNLIKFQHAYNAASRYINVVSEMIEHLIERLG